MSKRIYETYRVQGLTSPQKAVFNTLAIHADENDLAWPSNQTLATETSFGLRAVQEAIKYLIHIKYIKVVVNGVKSRDGTRFYEHSRKIKLLPDNWQLPDSSGEITEIDADDPLVKSGDMSFVKKR